MANLPNDADIKALLKELCEQVDRRGWEANPYSVSLSLTVSNCCIEAMNKLIVAQKCGLLLLLLLLLLMDLVTYLTTHLKG